MSAVVMAAKPASRFAGMIGLARSILINFVGASLVYRLAAHWYPASSPVPLLISSLVPAADLAWVFIRQRTVDVIAIISLVQLLVSIVITVASRSVDFALRAHALQAAALGLVFALSSLIGRPLIQPLARQSMAGDDPERQARFDQHATLPAVQQTFHRMTMLWALALCAESAVLFTAVGRITPANYLVLGAVINYGVTTALIWGSIRYGRYRSLQLKKAQGR